MMENVKALKLDSAFRPIDIIGSVEALVMCLLEKPGPLSHTLKQYVQFPSPSPFRQS